MTAEPTFDITTYWRVLRRRIVLLLIPVVLMTGILGLGSFLLPNIYRVGAQVVVRQEMDPAKGLAVDTQITQQLGGVIQALQQPLSQKDIYERLKPVIPKGVSLQGALNDYRDHLKIVRQESGKDLIVDFVYEGTPDKYAIEVVNAYAEEFQKQGTRLVANSLVLSLEFVDEQIKDQRARLTVLDERERKVKDKLAKDLGDLLPGAATDGLTKYVSEKLAQGDADYQKISLEIKSLEAQAQFLRSQLAVTKPTLELKSSGVGRGEQTEAALEQLTMETQTKLTALQMKYTEQHPEVVIMRRQLADLRARLASVKKRDGKSTRDESNPAYESLRKDTMQAEAQLRFLKSQQTELLARNTRLRKISTALPGYEDQLGSVRQEREALRKTHDSLMERKQVLSLNQSFEQVRNTGRFEVRRAGTVPVQPVRPNRKKFLVLGFVAGLFIGLSFMFLAEYLDHGIRSTETLRRYVDAPLLAVLPRVPR